MSYSNDQTQIRAGLVNYIGAMLASSKFENEQAIKHSVVAILLEEAAKLCKDNDGIFDMYTCKPALRLVAGIAKQRVNLLSELPRTKEVAGQIESYNFISDGLNKVIDNTKL